MAKSEKIFLFGTALLVGWTIVLGVTTWLQDLPCILSPNSCSSGEGLAQLLLFAPLILASALVAVGLLYDSEEKDFPRPLKVLAGIATMAVLLFVAFWAIALIGLATHGIYG